MWHLAHGVDEATSKEIPLGKRAPFLELSMIMPNMVDKSFSIVDNMPRDEPRIIKTHLPFELLPPNLLERAKVVFVSRNPKDALLSWYHHMEIMPDTFGYKGNFDQMADLFMNGQILYGSYFIMLKSGWASAQVWQLQASPEAPPPVPLPPDPSEPASPSYFHSPFLAANSSCPARDLDG